MIFSRLPSTSLAGMPEKEEWMRGYRRHSLLWTLFALGVVLPLGRSSRRDRGLAIFALMRIAGMLTGKSDGRPNAMPELEP